MKEGLNVTKLSRLKELDEERIQLLLMLSRPRTSVDDPITTSSISDTLPLKEENNRLIDERLKITDSMLGDPSRLLPVEMFIHIIDSTIRDTFIAGGYIETLLSFTLVSTRWRDVLMSTPSLWRHICLDKDTLYVQEKLSVTLHLSGNAPLAIWLRPTLDNDNWNEINGKLHQHYHRVTELMVDLSEGGHVPRPGIREILGDIGYLSSLERLSFVSWEHGNSRAPDISHFIERHPQLKEVAGIRLADNILKLDYMQKVTSFYSKHDPLSIIPYLDRMKRLTKVTFDDYGLDGNETANSDKENMAMSQYPNLLLPWVYYSQRGPPTISLLSRATTTLLSLELQTNLLGFTRLLQIIHEFQKLEDLELGLNTHPNDTIVIPSSPVQLCSSLQNVTISISFPWSSTSQRGTVAWAPMFAHLMRRSLSHIESIMIFSFERDFQFPWELVESSQFDSLKKLGLGLNLAFPEGADAPPHGFQLPMGLKYLTVSGIQCDLPNLSSTSVTSLSLSFFHASAQLNHNLWPSLTQLSVPASAIKWSGGSFKNLQNIALGSERDNKWDYGSQFCCELAICPDHMPQLQDIHFSSLPDWDILCILLERYNFRTEVGSTRISDISFRGDMPFFLLDIIKNLCVGKFVDRPSNFELSWVSNVDIICDQSLSGCIKCLKRLLPCSEPCTGNTITHHSQKNRKDVDLVSDDCPDIVMDIPLEDGMDGPFELRSRKLSIPVYPETKDEILATWDEREKAWQALVQGAWSARSSVCSGYARRSVQINEKDVLGPNKSTWYLSFDRV
ncbi:hypothetical protein FRB91_003441 [Serendipita sp. 411]|nr:hypothetical protein FRB91_003441 [Serendipita sp. 411]